MRVKVEGEWSGGNAVRIVGSCSSHDQEIAAVLYRGIRGEGAIVRRAVDRPNDSRGAPAADLGKGFDDHHEAPLSRVLSMGSKGFDPIAGSRSIQARRS
jgi:hypothetical protein